MEMYNDYLIVYFICIVTVGLLMPQLRGSKDMPVAIPQYQIKPSYPGFLCKPG